MKKLALALALTACLGVQPAAAALVQMSITIPDVDTTIAHGAPVAIALYNFPPVVVTAGDVFEFVGTFETPIPIFPGFTFLQKHGQANFFLLDKPSCDLACLIEGGFLSFGNFIGGSEADLLDATPGFVTGLEAGFTFIGPPDATLTINGMRYYNIVPEPSTWVMGLVGFGLMAGFGLQRKRHHARHPPPRSPQPVLAA